jgi:hypothetical protein
VCGLALDGGGEGTPESGVLLSGAADCEVHEVFARRFALCGIWGREISSLCRIRGCSLAGNVRAGINLDGLERGEHGDFIPNLASDCTICGGGKGIDLRRTIVAWPVCPPMSNGIREDASSSHNNTVGNNADGGALPPTIP